VTPLPQVLDIVLPRDEARKDDVLAAAVLLANFSHAAVYRREKVSDTDLNSPVVAVVGIGRVADPARMNFDYHQQGDDSPPTSTLTLVFDRLGFLPTARLAYPWLEPLEVLVSKGAAAAAKWAGTSPDVFRAVAANPYERFLLARVREAPPVIAPKTPLHSMLTDLGRAVLDPVMRLSARLELLTTRVKIHEVTAADGRVLAVVDASFIDRADDPTLGLETWIKVNCPGAAVTVTQDDRGDGLALFRRNDEPRVNFAVLAGTVGTTYAHEGGFVAKLAHGMDPLAAIRQSLTLAAAT
jgi:hypothetical protein